MGTQENIVDKMFRLRGACLMTHKLIGKEIYIGNHTYISYITVNQVLESDYSLERHFKIHMMNFDSEYSQRKIKVVKEKSEGIRVFEELFKPVIPEINKWAIVKGIYEKYYSS
jgi:hypothetical protein